MSATALRSPKSVTNSETIDPRSEELGSEMGLRQKVREGELRERIAGVDEGEGLKRGVFEEFLRKIYKRTK